jgi:hypothetical protein
MQQSIQVNKSTDLVKNSIISVQDQGQNQSGYSKNSVNENKINIKQTTSQIINSGSGLPMKKVNNFVESKVEKKS